VKGTLVTFYYEDESIRNKSFVVRKGLERQKKMEKYCEDLADYVTFPL